MSNDYAYKYLKDWINNGVIFWEKMMNEYKDKNKNISNYFEGRYEAFKEIKETMDSFEPKQNEENK